MCIRIDRPYLASLLSVIFCPPPPSLSSVSFDDVFFCWLAMESPAESQSSSSSSSSSSSFSSPPDVFGHLGYMAQAMIARLDILRFPRALATLVSLFATPPSPIYHPIYQSILVRYGDIMIPTLQFDQIVSYQSRDLFPAWVEIPPLPIKRPVDSNLIVVDDRLYVHTSEGPIYCYDPATQVWILEIATTPQRLKHNFRPHPPSYSTASRSALFECNEHITIVGCAGIMKYDPIGKELAHIDKCIYNPLETEWCGVWYYTDSYHVFGAGAGFRVHRSYSPDSGRWESRKPVSINRRGFTPIRFQGSLLLIGGSGPYESNPNVLRYVEASDDWEELPWKLPTRTTNPLVYVDHEECLHVIGGMSHRALISNVMSYEGVASTSHIVLESTSHGGRWRSLRPLPLLVPPPPVRSPPDLMIPAKVFMDQQAEEKKKATAPSPSPSLPLSHYALMMRRGTGIVPIDCVVMMLTHNQILCMTIGNNEKTGFALEKERVELCWASYFDSKWNPCTSSRIASSPEQLFDGYRAFMSSTYPGYPGDRDFNRKEEVQALRDLPANPDETPSPWRVVLRGSERMVMAESSLVGYILCWSPTNQILIIGMVLPESPWIREFGICTELWGVPITIESARKAVYPFMYTHPDTIRDRWRPYRHIPQSAIAPILARSGVPTKEHSIPPWR